MNEDERFVREHWKSVDPVHISGAIYIYYADDSYQKVGRNWSAARRFTEERLWQIRQVEEEIGYLSCRANFMVGEGWENHIAAIMKRILAREQAALDSLRRGMKQLAAQTATGKPAPMTDERKEPDHA